MTTQTAPAIPPRPGRSPQPPTSAFDMPKIPPRPTKHLDRSVSPMRDSYAPSPFNEWSGPGVTRTISNDLPQRPPSVTIPSLGEEGIEYADLDVGNLSDSHHQVPTETRNVSSDLKLHAPRPSLPKSSAKARVQAVTRIDSRQASAAGLGRDGSPDQEQERASRSLHSRASGSRGSRADSSTASSERPLSAHLGEEHGIRVPMYPNAGDVQAPSPSPYLEQPRSGRHHHRSRSGRDSSLPPGSYGLHGHGVQHADQFEKAWYEKHPDEYAKEEGQYGPGVSTPRPTWALSSDDLNKIVRGSGSAGSGLGTSPAMMGTPDEEVGYLASDEYTHRMTSPTPDIRHDGQPVVESPLRKMSFPASEMEQKRAAASPSRHGRTSSHGHHGEGGVIHVDDPMHPLYHPDGFAPTPVPENYMPDTEEALEDEDEPILASDEVHPESAYLHPAISPNFEHRDSFDENRSRTPSVTHSRSNSRSAGVSGGVPVLTRWDLRELREDVHTPLEDVEEYEPLFPEEDAKKERPVSAADRFRQRPDFSKHRFPSEDIWEDSPNSLQLHATVSTPDLPKRDTSDTFETPEEEAARRMQTSRVDSHRVATQILEGEGASAKVPERPNYAKQRFPSRDIWEDVPDSQQLVTTVEPATEELKSPDVPSKPSMPSRPERQGQQTSPTEKRQPPLIPDRPKPQIPVRPAKPNSLSPTESKEAPAIPKTKPSIPARPGGSNIAALKAGFLTDLNSRLQLGPQQPKPQEKESEPPAEKQPLSDVRKGRARGPARRKPATENANARLPSIPEIKITQSWNVWQVGEDGNLVVGGEESQAEKALPSALDEKPMTPPITQNVAGESVEPAPEPPAVAEDVVSPPGTVEASTEEVGTAEAPEPDEAEQPSAPKPEPEPESQSTESAKSAEALADSIPPSNLEDAVENMAAFADGKRPSDGDINHVSE